MAGNKLKTEKKKADSKKPQAKPADPDVLKPDKEPEVKVKELVKDERTHKVLGVTLLLLSLYCFIAFTSYLFSWQEDQDKVFRYSARILFSNDVEVDNLLGRLGAFVSHWFFYKGFGLASYLFCYFFFILGVNYIVGRRVFRVWRNIKYILFGLIFISTTLAFISGKASFPWGGATGTALNKWTSGFVGKAGMGLLLLVAGLSWVIWKFNIDFKIPEKKKQPPVKPARVAETGPVLHIDEEVEPKEDPTLEPMTATFRGNGLKEESGVTVIPPVTEEDFDPSLQLVEREDPAVKAPHITYIPPVIPPPVEEPLLELVEDDEPPFDMTEVTKPAELEVPEQPVSRRPKTAGEVAFEIKPPVEENVAEDDDVHQGPLPVREHVTADPYEPTLDLRDYRYPTLEMLESHGSDKIVQDASELEKNKNQIIDTLKNYDIQIQKISATVGPTVTLYEIVPAAGVRISRIKNLEDDIALSLSALGIRIIAPIPGKGTIGIEVPNVKKSIVSLRNMLASEKFMNSNMDLPVAIGKKIDNENFIADLAKMPHLLMAGATGQGKSVGINTLLVSLLYKNILPS
ncbi:DNA translocase FtsK 4TM domain-containing protein [Chitinophaga sedimenti]|uniref:DNA translocase FtsK 4TM domain-containing protein n=1 Tax=Chitinophaga sedimenti TaxID=2033606 RepID=UPI002005260F|nr:DNA translocase FtsK 4TM domain-containing protein [Chitinophaga sedimenti]MCK7553819.1 DNA translocase FtsK 4TM domain-containing protein [Chitinophaga sedimenti]